MESINFEIRLKADTALLVAWNKSFTGHRFVWSTGIKVNPSSFNPARPGKALKQIIQIAEQAYVSLCEEGMPISNSTLKTRIQLIRAKMLWVESELQIWDRGRTLYFPIADSINRSELDKRLALEISKQNPDFKKVIESVQGGGETGLFGFWESILDGKIKPRHGKKLRKETLKSKRQTLTLLKEYNPAITFDQMDIRFYNAFTTWLGDQVRKDKSKRFTPNTIGKHVKDLKSILRLAYRNELIDNTRFESWPVIREQNEVITLSKDELLKINSLNLSGTKDDVRDIFCLACFLGPRIGDFKALKKDALSVEAGITYFEYVQEKTGSRVKIPVHPVALEIIAKRNGEFPRMISEQNFRYNLKDICEMAELNDRVVIKIRDGKPTYKKKWEAISPHSARRTFASSLFYGWFGKPMPASFCMRYTGHRSEKSFMLYIGASEADLNAKALEYFDLKPVMKAS